MRSSRILPVDMFTVGANIKYVNIGVTRDTTASTVVVKLPRSDKLIQFCPYGDIPGELNAFCTRFNVIDYLFHLVVVTLMVCSLALDAGFQCGSVCSGSLGYTCFRVHSSVRGEYLASLLYINTSRSHFRLWQDGNGRLSRLLASIPLVKAGFPPLCIPPEQKPRFNQQQDLVSSCS